MSDELDTTGAVTPQRPTGKRSRRRALDTPAGEITESSAILEGDVVDDLEDTDTGSAVAVKTAKPKKAEKTGPSRNPFVFVITYLKQVVAELRKVIWPNRKQMISYTTVVLVFLAFMVALIGVVDLGLAKLVLLVFG